MVNQNNDVIFQAISDPTRRSIIEQLSHKKRIQVSELKIEKDMSKAGLSKHITILKNSNIIEQKKIGRNYYLSLNTAAVLLIDSWVSLLKTNLLNSNK